MARGGSRPGAGRKRKDPALSMTAAERELVAVPAGAAKMQPPMHLGDHEQLIFGTIRDVLEEQGRASPHYVEHVTLLAQRLAQVQRYKAVLEVEGDTYESPTATGGFIIRARPEVAMLSDAMRQAQSLIGELMLNPSAALKVASGKPDAPGEFDDF